MSKIPFVNAKKLYVRTTTKVKKPINIKENVLPKRVPIVDFLKGMQQHSSECVLLKLVPPYYKDHLPENERFPLVFSCLYKDEYSNLTVEKLIDIGKRLNYKLHENDLKMIEEKTRKQNHSAAWKRYRIGRVTASVCRQACYMKAADSNISLIRKICYPSSTQIRKKAILWGCNHEKDALAAYIKIEMKKHVNLKVSMHGLFVCDQLPYLAASPDGIVECDCCDRRVLELKCPYCLESEDRTIADVPYLQTGCLKEEHDYYYQVQTQMICTKTKIADFFVWSPRVEQGVYHFERIPRNVNICEIIIRRSSKFFLESIVPELLGAYYTTKKNAADREKL